MNRRIPPSLIKKPTGLIQMLKVLLIFLRTPKIKISNLKITPKMTRAVPVRGVGVLRSLRAVCEPHERVVGGQIFRMGFHKGLSLGPERSDGVRVVVDVDCEAVCFIIVGHELEWVVGYVAVEPISHWSI